MFTIKSGSWNRRRDGLRLAPRPYRKLSIRVGAAVLLCAVLHVSLQPAQAQFVQQGQVLVGSGGGGNQGTSSAISADGNTAIVGGPQAEAAWVFTRSGGVWTQQDMLVGSNSVVTSQTSPHQGSSVALSADGNTALVGGYGDAGNIGAVWVFTRSGTVWSQQGSKLVGTGAQGISAQGISAALSPDGNTAVVGGHADNGFVGAVWVWTRSGSVWSQQGSKLVGNDSVGSSTQGLSVALSGDGNTIVVGGSGDNGQRGAAWVFILDGGVWSQQGGKLFGSDSVGSNIQQGNSVAVSANGNTAIVGGQVDNSGVGAAWVYARSGGAWTQQGSKLLANDSTANAVQGYAVALAGDGNTALVGGVGDTGSRGAVFVYTRSADVWTQQGSKLVPAEASGIASAGRSLALTPDGNTAIVGGPGTQASTGAAWIFVQPPAAIAVSANSGTLDGGTNVTITGTHFTGATGVTFDGTAATNVVVVDDTTITATTPAHPAGAVDVVVASEHGSGTGAAAYTYELNASSTLLDAPENPSVFGQSVTFTAMVTGSGATGTVTFKDGGTTIGSDTLLSGTATFSTSLLEVGAHTITAVYSGDGSFATSTSSDFAQTINQGETTTALGSSVNPSVSGQSVTFTATVSPTSPAAGTRTGTVTFKDGGTTIGSDTLSSGAATFSTGLLAVGPHTITAVYAGDTNFAASTSPGTPQTVNKRGTTTSVSATPNPSRPGQPVSINATVAVTAPGAGTPTGTVTFKEGTTTLGTGMLASGEATFTTSALKIGSHTVSATYAGTATFATSTSSVNVTVDPRVGAEFRVNTVTTNQQNQPSVARLTNNGFVVTWTSEAQDGSSSGIYGQRYTNNGVRSGTEFRVNATTADSQANPSVAGLVGNAFVVTWESNAQDGSNLGVYGRRYTAAGAPVGPEFRVNTVTQNNQWQPSVAGFAAGGFVVAWTSNGQDGSLYGVYAKRYDASGNPAGAEFRVNTTTANKQQRPAVAALSGGGFVVTWTSDGQDGSGLGIYGQRYTAVGAPAGAEFRINTYVNNDQAQSVAAGLSDGKFIVAWESNIQDGSLLGVYGQRYSNVGAKTGSEFRVNTVTAMDQSQPSVAAFTDGGFVVTWTSRNQDGSGLGIYGQVYDAAGARVNIEFRINTTTANNQSQPSVAAFSGGNFVVTWTSDNQDGSLAGVYGQRFQFMGL